MPTARARGEWQNRVAAEYRSAAIAARTLHLGVACGLPGELLRTGARIVADELAHADLCHEVACALGADASPITVDVDALLLGGEAPPLVELVDRVVRDFAFGETYAVPLFAAMARGATDDVARRALTQILKDEAVHRAFGWTALDALLAIGGDEIRRHIAAGAPRWLQAFAESYDAVTDAPPITDAEIAAGLLPGHIYAAVFLETTQDIRRRLSARGIELP